MPIDLESLSVQELFELNDRIIRRVHYLCSLNTRAHLDRFEPGDRVAFQCDGRAAAGVVVRVNRKTLSIKSKDSRWKVPPQFVTKLARLGAPAAKTIEEILGEQGR
jgi:hypothetical protein